MSGINRQPECLEVPVKGKTGDVIEHMSYYNKRNGITKGYFFISGEFLENLLSCPSCRIIIVYDGQGRLDTVKKLNGKSIACTVSQQSNGFADNVPRGIKHDRIVFTVFKELTTPFVIGVVRS
jgi:hypothetical protein